MNLTVETAQPDTVPLCTLKETDSFEYVGKHYVRISYAQSRGLSNQHNVIYAMELKGNVLTFFVPDCPVIPTQHIMKITYRWFSPIEKISLDSP